MSYFEANLASYRSHFARMFICAYSSAKNMITYFLPLIRPVTHLNFANLTSLPLHTNYVFRVNEFDLLAVHARTTSIDLNRDCEIGGSILP